MSAQYVCSNCGDTFPDLNTKIIHERREEADNAFLSRVRKTDGERRETESIVRGMSTASRW